jgi:ureidoglycolate lyase
MLWEIRMRISVEPLAVASFALFGTIIEQDSSAPLQRFDMVHEHGGAARTPGFALITIETPVILPLQIQKVEMHPHSAQTFLPLLGGASLVFACESGPDGEPRLETARAFRATGRQGVCYRRGVWHHRLSPLETPSQYGVIMTHAAEGEDTVIYELPEPVLIVG